MEHKNWKFIEETPTPESGGTYLVELDDGMYTLAKCTSSWVAGDGSPVVTWLPSYYDYDMKLDLPVKRWRETHEGEVRHLITEGLRAIQRSREIAEALKAASESQVWIPDPGDARHKEIMDMLKGIRDAVTSAPDVTIAPAGAPCVCNLYGKAQIAGGYTCPVHGLQK